MSEWKKLLKEAQARAAEARQLLEEHSADGHFEDPDVAKKFDELMEEAEALRTKSQNAQAAEERNARMNGLTTYFGQTTGRRTSENEDTANQNPAATGLPDAPDQRHTIPALYEMRWGALDGSVKTLAYDLYGDHYAQKRLAGWTAFTKYLRKGEHILSGDEYNLLKSEPILTPGQLEFYAKAGASFTEVKETLVEATDSLGGLVAA